jgi:hypothetical protein
MQGKQGFKDAGIHQLGVSGIQGFRVSGRVFRGSGFRFQSLAPRVQDVELRVEGRGSRVHNSGFEARSLAGSLGFRVLGGHSGAI